MEELLHPSDDLNDPLPPEPQTLLDCFRAYAVWHPRLLQVRTQVLDTIWEPADVVFTVVCGPSGAGSHANVRPQATRSRTCLSLNASY